MNYEYGRVEFLEWAYNMLKFSRLMVYYANLYSATLVACLTWQYRPKKSEHLGLFLYF
jgi:hypothetical protein